MSNDFRRFHELAMKLLERDANCTNLGEDGTLLWLRLGLLSLSFHVGPDLLNASLVHHENDVEIVFSETHNCYDRALVREWIPKLEAHLVLEELADV